MSEQPNRRKFIASLGAFALMAGATTSLAQDDEDADEEAPDGMVWHVPTLGEEQDRAYEEFFRVESMSMGIYKLPAGGRDGQSPHREDEIYYVVEGVAKIEIEDEVSDIEPGSLIYVAKRKTPSLHRD